MQFFSARLTVFFGRFFFVTECVCRQKALCDLAPLRLCVKILLRSRIRTIHPAKYEFLTEKLCTED